MTEMIDINKTIDGFAYWIENEEKGVCHIPLNLCEKVLELLKSQRTEIKQMKSESRVVPCRSCVKRGTNDCIIGMASETDRTVHGCTSGEWKEDDIE